MNKSLTNLSKVFLRHGVNAKTLGNKHPLRGHRPVIKEKPSFIINKAVKKSNIFQLISKRNIFIVAPDDTRHAYLKEILTELLRFKEFKDKNISVLFANGLHKPMNNVKIKKLVGERLFSKVNFLNHSLKAKDLKKIGFTKKRIPIVLNRNLFEDNFIISIGVVEPHLYAGFSGGAKTIAIGLSGRKCIDMTHHPRFLDDSRVRLGSVRSNPFNQTLRQIVKNVKVDLAINIINGVEGELQRCFVGKVDKVYKDAVRLASSYFDLKVDKKADVIICGLEKEKSHNIYQASRVFNYITNTRRPIIKKNGLILCLASLEDGFGKGIGEKKFKKALQGIGDLDKFIKKVQKRGCVAGEHRAYMVAKALKLARLGFITKERGLFKNTPLFAFEDQGKLISFIKKEVKNPLVIVIPNVFSVIANIK